MIEQINHATMVVVAIIAALVAESKGEYIANPQAMHNSAKAICTAMAVNMPAIIEPQEMVGRFGAVIAITSGVGMVVDGNIDDSGGLMKSGRITRELFSFNHAKTTNSAEIFENPLRTISSVYYRADRTAP